MMTIIDPKLQFKSPLTPIPLENVKYIVIHHIKASKASIEDIHQWHLDHKPDPWLGCGYNEYIRKDGTIYKGREMNEGAHCQGYNAISYGIALEGDFNTEKATEVQLKTLIIRIKELKPLFKNLQCVVGHKALFDTQCPGKNFDLSYVLTEIERVEIKEHWAADDRRALINKGIVITDERFDDKITRGEVFVLLNQIVK